MATKRSTKAHEDDSPFVTISVSIAAITVALVAVVLIFSKEDAYILPFLVGSLAVMGIFMGYFASNINR